MNDSTEPAPPFNRLSRFYILALSFIALLTITGFFIIQWALYQQSNDAHIINLAGRQRMLSENLSKTALIIQLSTDNNNFFQSVEKFRQVLTLWEQSHNGLQFGEVEMELPGKNSAAVTRLFAELQPHYQAMKIAADNLLVAVEQNNWTSFSELVEQLIIQQPAFVQKMDAIVSQYEAEALSRMTQMKILVFLIASIILIVLLFEGLYLFRPTIAEIRKLNLELEQRVDHHTTQLDASEERYRRIVNTTQEGICVLDTEIRISFLNQRLADMLGYSIQEMQGYFLFDLFDKKHFQEAEQYFERCKRGIKEQFDFRLFRKDGSQLWTIINATPFFDDKGEFMGILGMMTDITERKQAEFAQQRSLDLLQKVLSSLNESVMILNPHTRQIEDCNEITELMFGYPREELIEQKVSLLHVNKSRYQQFGRKKILFFKSKGFFEQEFQMKRKNGEVFATEHFVRPLYKENGQLYKEVSVIRDITERKQAEETLKNIVNGVASAGIGTTFLKSLVEHIAKTLQMKLAFIGQRHGNNCLKLKTLFLVTDKQLVDNIEYDLRHSPCKEIFEKNHFCYYPEKVQQQFPQDSWLVEQGIESYFGTPLFDANGQTIGLMVIMDDKPLIHIKQIKSMLQIFAARASAELERIQALEALQQERASLTQRVQQRTAELTVANAELARAARLKDEFLACMSHELRTPLNAVLGMSEILQEGVYGSLNPKQSHSVRIIEESGRHLLSIINDILVLTRIDAGKIKLEIIPVSIEGVANACLRIIKDSAQKKQIKTSVKHDTAVTMIQADERYLMQILLNLLNNAIKFTPKGGDVNLEICGNAEQGIIYFIVADTGIGIAEKDMQNMFKPFLQLDGGLNRAYEGTGLGLSLVYRLTDLHGGSVSVESELGKGTRFIVSLPWQQITDTFTNNALSPKPQPSKPASTESSSVGALKALILLADDNLITLETVSDYLKAKGHQVILAYDGVQAFEKTVEENPDLILMDIQMPRMDGLEATRRIRATTEIATTPIIALTALAMSGDKERCLEAGVNDYLSKPVSFKKLMAVIEAQLWPSPSQ